MAKKVKFYLMTLEMCTASTHLNIGATTHGLANNFDLAYMGWKCSGD
jgi:hypothetical protein